jgi:hypothetical protein
MQVRNNYLNFDKSDITVTKVSSGEFEVLDFHGENMN